MQDKLMIRDTDFNPLPSHEGRPGVTLTFSDKGISIHSPHTRGDENAKRKRIAC